MMLAPRKVTMTAALILAALTVADVASKDAAPAKPRTAAPAAVAVKTGAALTAKTPVPAPITVPPGESVEIPAATPQAPSYTLTLPFETDAASKEDLAALEARVDALTARVDAATESVAGLVRTLAPAPAAPRTAQSHGCLKECDCATPGQCGTLGCNCQVAEKPAVKAASAANAWPSPAPQPVVTDAWGQRWTLGTLRDATALNAWVADQNAKIAAQRQRPAPRAPVYGYAVGSGCANGSCYRR